MFYIQSKYLSVENVDEKLKIADYLFNNFCLIQLDNTLTESVILTFVMLVLEMTQKQWETILS